MEDDRLPPFEALNVDGTAVHYARAGRGPDVFLGHGLGASSYSWRRAWRRLAEHRTVHIFDWPGHGRSAKPRDFDYSPRGYSRFLVALMDRLGVAKADLVGNSLGGLVSLLTALERPDRAASLTLIGTPTYLESRPKFLWTLRRPVVGRLFEWSLGAWAVRYCAGQVYMDRAIVTRELIDEYSLALRSPEGRRAVAQFVRNAIPPDADALQARFRTLSTPTLILWGEFDCMVSRAAAERFAAEVPGARLIPLAGCGHAPQEERPDLIAAALREFWSAPSGRA